MLATVPTTDAATTHHTPGAVSGQDSGQRPVDGGLRSGVRGQRWRHERSGVDRAAL